jgi:hypothetical protein
MMRTVLVGSLLLVACGEEDGSPNEEDPTGQQPDAARDEPRSDAASTQADASSATDAGSDAPSTPFALARGYAGSYVAKITMRKVESVGALGSMNALVTLIGKFDVTADEAKQTVTAKATYCHVELDGVGTGALTNSGVVTPDIVMTTTVLDPVPFTATRGSDGKVSWSMPEIHGPVGWAWGGPGDPIPTASSDNRVRDQDNDGNPGVTTSVTLNEVGTPVYVVQTMRDVYQGAVEANGDLVGNVVDRSEQKVLGSPNPLLSVAALVEQPDPNTADNIIRMRKVEKSLPCTDVVAQAGTLFP